MWCEVRKDSAVTKKNNDFVIKSISRETTNSQAETPHQAMVCDAAVSLQQSPEWGMQALEGSMPLLKACWHWEEKDKHLVGLTVITLLHNFKANNMDLHQICAVHWNPHCDVSQDNSQNISNERSSDNVKD